MLNTSALRREWAPACRVDLRRLNLNGSGVVLVRKEVADAVRALNVCLVHWKYRTRRADTGAYNCRKITGGTGYSLHAYGIAIDINWQTNPYGPRLVTDMPRDMVDQIKKIRTKSGHRVWGWGGDYRTNKDAMHFEIVCTPEQLATGIRAITLPGKPSTNPTPTPKPTPAPAPTPTPEDTIVATLSDSEAQKLVRDAAEAADKAERARAGVARIEEALDNLSSTVDQKAAVMRDPRDGKAWVISDAGRWHVKSRATLNVLIFVGIVQHLKGDIPVADPKWLDDIPVIDAPTK